MIHLPKNQKPEEVAAKEASRYALNEPWYDQKLKAVCATDGRMAVVLPVDASEDEPTGQIPRDALKAFRRATPRSVSELQILGVNGSVICNGITMPRDTEDLRVPDVKAVVPLRDANGATGTGTCKVIHLNAKMLASLAKAMGSDVIRIQITDESSPIRVDATEGAAYGALMPVAGA